MRLVHVLAAFFLLVASACSGSPNDRDASDSSDGELLALEREAPTTRVSSTSTSTSGAAETPEAVEATTTTEREDNAEPSATTTPVPGNGAAAPATGGGASDDLMAAYTGALGSFTVDELLFGPPAALPTVAGGAAPLTGLPSDRSDTSAIVVKIDNSSKARPQAGLDQADVVIEQEVEGGVTRLAAIFHSAAPERIGPVRSARTTDISFLSALGRPGLAYSGANEVVDTLIMRQDRVRNYSAARFGGYWRDSNRPAPSNLYTGISEFSTQATAPPAWFAFAADPVDRGQPVSSFVASFPSTSATWTWTGNRWERSQDGRAHTNEAGITLHATNVVVAQVTVVDSGLRDSTGAIAPEQVWVGNGPVAVFTNGRRIDGEWTRSRLGEPAVFVADDGSVIELTPGNTWIELVRSLP